MITPEDLLERLRIQLEDLVFMLFDQTVCGGKICLSPESPSPKLAVEFGEALILCPSEESAKSRVESDREGARAFLSIAEVALQRVKDGDLQLAPRRREEQTPFFLLVSLVREYMDSKT
jgi:hypothetical protein